MKDSLKISEDSRQDDFSDICESCESICCKGARPPLTSERISIIEAYLLMERTDAKRAFERGRYTFPRETSDGHCVFFDIKKKRCNIHPVKPETCVAGPITFDINLDEERIAWYLKSEEICRLAGKLYREKNKLHKHLESAKREINALIGGLSREELLAILSIDEPETFKIGEDYVDSKVLVKLR